MQAFQRTLPITQANPECNTHTENLLGRVPFPRGARRCPATCSNMCCKNVFWRSDRQRHKNCSDASVAAPTPTHRSFLPRRRDSRNPSPDILGTWGTSPARQGLSILRSRPNGRHRHQPAHRRTAVPDQSSPPGRPSLHPVPVTPARRIIAAPLADAAVIDAKKTQQHALETPNLCPKFASSSSLAEMGRFFLQRRRPRNSSGRSNCCCSSCCCSRCCCTSCFCSWRCSSRCCCFCSSYLCCCSISCCSISCCSISCCSSYCRSSCCCISCCCSGIGCSREMAEGALRPWNLWGTRNT